MRDFEYQITDHLATLSGHGAYTKELNLVSYAGAPPVLDLRRWQEKPDGTKQINKGLTLTTDEAAALRDALNNYLGGIA